MNSNSESIVDLANLTDNEKKELKKKMSYSLQEKKRELNANLTQITAAKDQIKIRAFECIHKTKLKEEINRLWMESVLTELVISLLRNHFQELEQGERLQNKKEEKKRKADNKRLIAKGLVRISHKEQRLNNLLETIREKEEALKKITLVCKCKRDFLEKIAAHENINTIIELEINLLTKYLESTRLS